MAFAFQSLRGNGYVKWDEEVSSELSHSALVILHQFQRRENEVDRYGDLDCLLTASLEAKYNGWETAVGTMFTVRPMAALEVLSFEFDAFEQAQDLSVQVYYRKGEFAGANNDPFQWKKLADVEAQFAPDEKGAIIPANDFTAVSLEAGETYAFYLRFRQSNVFRTNPTQRLIGEDYLSNNVLGVQVGVNLEDGPFPDKFGAASEFPGRIHYRTALPCEQIRTTTQVELLWAVNSEPEGDVIAALSDSVEGAISALTISNLNLIRFDKFHLLEIMEVVSGFQGRSGKFFCLFVLTCRHRSTFITNRLYCFWNF
jgi:hypothetical protein